MDEATLAELQEWAATTEDAPGVSPHDTVQARVQALIDAEPGDRGAEEEFVRWAERTAQRGPTAEVRSTARVLLALVRDRTPPRTLKTVDPPARIEISRRAGLIATAVGVVVIAGGVVAARLLTAPAVHVRGPSGLIDATQARAAAFTEPAAADVRHQRWTLDGRDVTSQVHRRGHRLVFAPTALQEGAHQLEVAQSGGLFGAQGHARLVFQVDLTPPVVTVPDPIPEHSWPVDRATVSGSVNEAARVWVEGRPLTLEDDRFTLELDNPPAELSIVAIDTAGNRSVAYVPVAIEPRAPAVPIRAVHMTAISWSTPSLKHGVMQLIAQHRINAVELDLKDEGGVVGFDPAIPFARRIGAAQPIYDLSKAVAQLHALGIRVIGRVVCFRDPIAASAAWKLGRRDMVVQAPNGTPYSGYGGFLNVGDEAARRYNIDVAVAAARAGVDDILYDYVRRPDGPIGSMRFPGMRVAPEVAVVEFLKETRAALRPYGTFLGASVFGIAVTNPDEVAQNVPAMARQVDYIAPLDYPSHWANGSYGVADPNAEPYAIIQRSLLDFKREVAGTGARLVPWLQDFSLGVAYGPAQIDAQIAAAAKDGVHEFIMWDPNVTYTAAALTTNAPTSKEGLAKPVG